MNGASAAPTSTAVASGGVTIVNSFQADQPSADFEL